MNRAVRGVSKRAIVELPFVLLSEYVIDGTEAEVFSDKPLKITDEIEVCGFNACVAATDGKALDYAELAVALKLASYAWYLDDRRFLVMPFSFICRKEFTPFIKERFKNIEFKTSISYPEPPKVSRPIKIAVFVVCKSSVF